MNGRKYSDCTYCTNYHKTDKDFPCSKCEQSDRPFEKPNQYIDVSDLTSDEFFKNIFKKKDGDAG